MKNKNTANPLCKRSVASTPPPDFSHSKSKYYKILITGMIVSFLLIINYFGLETQKKLLIGGVVVLFLTAVLLTAADVDYTIHCDREPNHKNLKTYLPSIAITIFLSGYILSDYIFRDFDRLIMHTVFILINNCILTFFKRKRILNYEVNISAIVISTISAIVSLSTNNYDITITSIIIQTFALYSINDKEFPGKDYSEKYSYNESQVKILLVRVAMYQLLIMLMIMSSTEPINKMYIQQAVFTLKIWFVYLSILTICILNHSGEKKIKK